MYVKHIVRVKSKVQNLPFVLTRLHARNTVTYPHTNWIRSVQQQLAFGDRYGTYISVDNLCLLPGSNPHYYGREYFRMGSIYRIALDNLLEARQNGTRVRYGIKSPKNQLDETPDIVCRNI